MRKAAEDYHNSFSALSLYTIDASMLYFSSLHNLRQQSARAVHNCVFSFSCNAPPKSALLRLVRTESDQLRLVHDQLSSIWSGKPL